MVFAIPGPAALLLWACAVGAARAVRVANEHSENSDCKGALSCNCLNPNTANVHELTAIHGIDQELAMRVIMGRTCFYVDARDFENKIRAQGRSGPGRWDAIKPVVDRKALCVSCTDAVDVNGASSETLGQVPGLTPELGKAIVAGRSCLYQTPEDLLRRVGGADYAANTDEGSSYAAKLGRAMAANSLCTIFGETAYEPAEELRAQALEHSGLAAELRTAVVNAKEVESDVAVMQADEPQIKSIRCAPRKMDHLHIPELIVGEEPKEVQCDEGYVFSGDAQSLKVSCGADGEVRGIEGHRCQPVDCGDPVPLFGGARVATFEGASAFNGGKPVQVTCKAGFSLDGKPDGLRSAAITCLKTRTWSETGLKCLNTACGGQRSMEVRCPEGSSFNGRACGADNCAMTLTCGEGGWQESPRPCVPVSCSIPDLRTVTGVTVTGAAKAGALVYREQVGFSCEAGRTFNGKASGHQSRTFTCGADGKLRDEDLREFTATPACQPVTCGRVEDAPWWQRNAAFYGKLFPEVTMQSAVYGGEGAKLQCTFSNAEHQCLHKYVVDRLYNIMGTVSKQRQITIRCGPDGQWAEPTAIQTQTCAYPISPKRVRPRKGTASLLPSKADGRVLTVIDQVSRLEMKPYDRYDTKQSWVLEPSGLIRSAHHPSMCLTAKHTDGTKWLEDYLFLAPCTVLVDARAKTTAPNEKIQWELNTNLAREVREGGAQCKTDQSCCSLIFKEFSKKLLGLINTGSYYMTFPQPEGLVVDWMMQDYYWYPDGTVYEHWKDTDGNEFKHWRGKRVDGNGNIMLAPGTRPTQLKQNFNLQNEPYPKALQTVKMSSADVEYSIVDFWMA